MRNECPVCDNKNIKNIVGIKIKPFDDSPFDNFIDVASCPTCDFAYTKNISFDENDLERYYANLSKYSDKNNSTGGGQNPNDLIRLKETALFLNSYFEDKSISILDIGCSNGGLLNELKKLGFNNLMGIDPSSDCVLNTESFNINAKQGNVRNIDEVLNNEKYDLVIFSHVYEHLLNPKETTINLKKILKRNGKVYVECPDAESYCTNIHSPFQEFNTEHINHFSVSSLKNLFINNGFYDLYSDVKTLKIDSGNYYACYGLFVMKDQLKKTEFISDGNVEKTLLDYSNISKLQMQNIFSQINSKINPDFPLAFYGTGQFCMKLLSLVYKKDVKILYDGSYINWGRTINNIEVLNPESISKNKNLNIVITSIISADKIEDRIKELTNNLKNINIIKIYNYE